MEVISHSYQWNIFSVDFSCYIGGLGTVLLYSNIYILQKQYLNYGKALISLTFTHLAGTFIQNDLRLSRADES